MGSEGTKGKSPSKSSTSKQGKAKESKSTDLAPPVEDSDITQEEVVYIETWKLMEDNPLYKGLPKPSQDYIAWFLSNEPRLKKLSDMERREQMANIVILGWLRDSLASYVMHVQSKHPKEWKEHIETKDIRVAVKAMEVQSELMRTVFAETTEEFVGRQTGQKITRILIKETIEFGEEEKPKKKSKKKKPKKKKDDDIIDAEYRVVDDDAEKPDRK